MMFMWAMEFIMRKIFERIKKIFLGKYYDVDKENKEMKTVWLVDIGVHPNYRRCGIGSELFENAREIGLEKYIVKIMKIMY